MLKNYRAIGLMSGSSLDGLDIALCRFALEPSPDGPRWAGWELLEAETLPFSDEWQQRLRSLPKAIGRDLAAANADLGHYLGALVNRFFEEKKLGAAQVDLIASHGHTIFHEPARGFTLQIGDGAALAAATGCTVVSDFRTADVALGGQGAPLAPMADKLLFPGYDFYLNLGGIANLTCRLAEDRWVAFDVTGANQMLNAIALQSTGAAFDEAGRGAAKGSLLPALGQQMNALPFFALPYPKSLSNQWVEENLTRACLAAPGTAEDRLYTACRHVAFQLAAAVAQVLEKEVFSKTTYTMLATGGGVFNDFLMRCIREACPAVELVVPEPGFVKFKEAALMALLGVMRMEGLPNCISSVTGARKNAVGGAVHHPS